MSALLSRLIDDAALFPPERAPMDEALPAYREVCRDPVVGRFLCPASRFAELRTHLVPEDLLDLAVIADTGIEELPKALDDIRAEPRVRLSSVEITLPGDADQARAAAVMIAQLPPDVPAHIEVRRSPGWREALDRIAAARDAAARDAGLRGRGALFGARYRVGGPAAEAVPSVAELAAFISACAERDLPFTCAAGPEHAVRNASHHGFLNLLLATAHAATANHVLRRTLERGDVGGLVGELVALTGDEARAARRLLVAFGSSRIRRARTDLAAVGLIRTPDAGEDMSP